MNDTCDHNFDEVEKLPHDQVISIIKCERCRLMAVMLKSRLEAAGGSWKPMGFGTPQWTSDKPAQEGWYWFRIVGDVDRTVIRVTLNGDGYLQAEEPSSWVERGDLDDTSSEEWAGPLEEPPA